jgi:electron transfer flavoprotein beta subunit
MNIAVCIKQVPDTASRIEVKEGRVVEEGLAWVVNPYDEYATEEALRIKERFGEGKVTLITMGPERARGALTAELAKGADEAIHLTDPAFEGSDPYATARILAQTLQRVGYDLILCGWKGVDHDEGQTAIILAEMLDLPHVSFVVKLDIAEDGSKAVAHRQVEGATEVVETPLPAVFTAQKGLNEPRYASLRGIMSVKKKSIAEWGAEDLGLDPGSVGPEGSLTEIVEVVPPPERPPGRVIPGEPEASVKELVRRLREEAKVI